MNAWDKLVIFVVVLVVTLANRPAISQDHYPSKPIRMVIGLAPGGAVDLTGRRLAGKLAEQLGVSVVVDSKPGGNSVIAHDFVARAEPDGYTIIFNSGSLVQGYALSSKIAYDPLKDFSPIALFSKTPLTVVVNASFPAKNMSEFIAHAKANPNKLSYGTAGTGNITHLAGLLFLQAAGISAVHVPYKGSGPALVDLMGGHIQFSTASVSSISSLVRDNRLKALALMNAKRSLALPDVPTFKEAGIPNLDVSSWVGVMGPARMTSERVRVLNAEIRKALQDPLLKANLARDGSEPLGSTPEQYAAFISSELNRWTKVIKENRLQSE